MRGQAGTTLNTDGTWSDAVEVLGGLRHEVGPGLDEEGVCQGSLNKSGAGACSL